MYIYRIEHKDTERGPYNSETSFQNDPRLYRIGLAHTDDDHPSMWIDCTYVYKNGHSHSDYYCGFSTIDQMVQWFDQWFDALHNNGFKLVMYRIAKNYTIAGKRQTIFVKERVTSRKVIDLDSVTFLEMIGV